MHFLVAAALIIAAIWGWETLLLIIVVLFQLLWRLLKALIYGLAIGACIANAVLWGWVIHGYTVDHAMNIFLVWLCVILGAGLAGGISWFFLKKMGVWGMYKDS